jgi:Ribbon-helix-helix protein, copG family
MNKSTVSVNGKPKRKPGRPATGVDQAVAVRLPANVLAEVDKWAADNGSTRSDAIRQLIERGLRPAVTPADTARASKPRKAAKAAPVKKTRQRRL